jgi:predicted ATPase
VIDGYQSLKFAEAGEQHRVLWVGFGDDGDRRKETMYRLDELSHGQRTLMVLYTLIEFFRGQNAGPFLLCIDEPENFVALPELQPWLVTLHDYCLDGSLQAILVSHHPEFIDYLAARNGVWFDRQPNSPVRVHRLDTEDGGLPISELVARGWIDG